MHLAAAQQGFPPALPRLEVYTPCLLLHFFKW